MHEASMHTSNCFLTLTYSDKHLPPYGSLDRKAFPLFMKRLRKAYPDDRIRYYHCGEYGAETRRPHYHSLLFGFDFPDKEFWKDRGEYKTWRSPTLENLWPFGLSEIGSVTHKSAGYVARTIVTGKPKPNSNE